MSEIRAVIEFPTQMRGDKVYVFLESIDYDHVPPIRASSLGWLFYSIRGRTVNVGLRLWCRVLIGKRLRISALGSTVYHLGRAASLRYWLKIY